MPKAVWLYALARRDFSMTSPTARCVTMWMNAMVECMGASILALTPLDLTSVLAGKVIKCGTPLVWVSFLDTHIHIPILPM